MNVTLFEETAQLQKEIRRVRATVEKLEAQVDELVIHLQTQLEIEPRHRRFTDLEGIWAGADFTFEEIQAAEYRLPEELP